MGFQRRSIPDLVIMPVSKQRPHVVTDDEDNNQFKNQSQNADFEAV